MTHLVPQQQHNPLNQLTKVPIVHQSFPIATGVGNQGNAFVYWSGHSFLISWEDSRMTADSPEIDIFFQEYKDGDIIIITLI